MALWYEVAVIFLVNDIKALGDIMAKPLEKMRGAKCCPSKTN